MPLFLHSVGDLSETVHFKKLSLSTSNTFIYTKVRNLYSRYGRRLTVPQSVLADIAEYHTSNGKIAGNFTTNDTLTLRTSNGGIIADINALHSGSDKPVRVFLRTSNGYVFIVWAERTFLIISYQSHSLQARAAGYHKEDWRPV